MDYTSRVHGRAVVAVRRSPILGEEPIDQTGGGTLLATRGDATAEQLSILEINGAYVTGGYARTEGEYSEIHLIGGAVLDDVEIDGVVVPDGQIGAFAGTIVNNDVLGVAPDGREVTMFIPVSDQAILSGQDASVELGGELVAWLGSFSNSFTNASGHTIEGAGVIFGDLVNEGTIRANYGGAEAEVLALSAPGNKVSYGTLEAVAGGILEIEDSVSGSGDLLVRGGRMGILGVGPPGGVYADDIDVFPGSASFLDVDASTVVVTNDLDITGGVVTLSGDSNVTVGGAVTICPDTDTDPDAVAVLDIQDSTLTAASVQLCADGDGLLSGNGTVAGDVQSDAGRVAPGITTGVLTVVSDYTQAVAGTLEIELGGLSQGSQYDLLDVSGTAALDGTLAVTLVNGFQPERNDAFTILAGAAVQGQFALLDLPALGEGLVWTIEYGTTGVLLRVARDSVPDPFGASAPLDPVDIRPLP